MHRHNLLLVPIVICPLSESRKIPIDLFYGKNVNISGSTRMSRAEQMPVSLPNNQQ